MLQDDAYIGGIRYLIGGCNSGVREKVLQQIRGAVSEEMVLPVDMSKGVAGALLARAAGLKRLAVQVSNNADRIERAYQDRRAAA